MTKVKTREDELERTQVANNLYLETLGAEVKTLAEKSRDLQHATEKVKDQLHSTVPGMLTKIVSTSSENDAFWKLLKKLKLPMTKKKTWKSSFL